MLNNLMIDFNNGLIIQMTLQEKTDLKKKLLVALRNRDQMSEVDQNIQIGPMGKHLSDNDLSVLQENQEQRQKMI